MQSNWNEISIIYKWCALFLFCVIAFAWPGMPALPIEKYFDFAGWWFFFKFQIRFETLEHWLISRNLAVVHVTQSIVICPYVCPGTGFVSLLFFCLFHIDLNKTHFSHFIFFSPFYPDDQPKRWTEINEQQQIPTIWTILFVRNRAKGRASCIVYHNLFIHFLNYQMHNWTIHKLRVLCNKRMRRESVCMRLPNISNSNSRSNSTPASNYRRMRRIFKDSQIFNIHSQ